MILVDTSILLSILYGERGSAKAEALLRRNQGSGVVASVVSLAEILGVAGRRSPVLAATGVALVERWVGSRNLVEVTREIAHLAGEYKAKYHPTLSLGDCLILATAVDRQCSALATLDKGFLLSTEIRVLRP